MSWPLLPMRTPPAPESYVIQGQVVRLPVVVRDASSAFASFVVPSAAVRKLLPAGLQPAELLPGRTLCSIAGIEYRDNDLGRYNEVAVAFIAREGRGAALPLIDLIRGRVGAYIHRLPVTEAFTCEAGSTIWGFPKTIEKISITEEGGRRICKLMMGGAHVLTLSVKSSGRWRLPRVAADGLLVSRRRACAAPRSSPAAKAWATASAARR